MSISPHTSSKKVSDGCPCHRKVTIPPHTSSKKIPMASHAIRKHRFRQILPQKSFRWLLMPSESCDSAPYFLKKISDGFSCHQKVTISLETSLQPCSWKHFALRDNAHFVCDLLAATFLPPCHAACNRRFRVILPPRHLRGPMSWGTGGGPPRWLVLS